MPLHDWTKVEAGIFHDFHTVWIAEMRSAFNEGLLPADYYALAEKHAGHFVTDVLKLHVPPSPEELAVPIAPDDDVGVSVADMAADSAKCDTGCELIGHLFCSAQASSRSGSTPG